MPRRIRNIALAEWVGASHANRLSLIVNNNPQGVINWLTAHGVTIKDVNANNTIDTPDLYAALVDYANENHGGIKNLADMLGELPHNDNAPAQWNLKAG